MQTFQTFETFEILPDSYGVWETTIEGIKYIGGSEKQVLEMVRRIYPTVEPDKTDTKHHQYVFHPRKFPLK